MIEFSSSLKLNEIHTVDNPFNEDPKNIIFSRETLSSGEGWSENLGKMGQSIVMQIGGWSILKENYIQPLLPGTKILVMLQFFYMPDQILGGKMKKTQFLCQNLTFL